MRFEAYPNAWCVPPIGSRNLYVGLRNGREPHQVNEHFSWLPISDATGGYWHGVFRSIERSAP